MKSRTIFYNLLLVVAIEVFIEARKEEKEFNLNFQQDDYQVRFERIELARYNKVYLKEIKVITFKYNRTTPVVNFTFLLNIDIGNDMRWVFQGYKFMSNEYRLFPVRFGASMCKALSSNVAGFGRFMDCGNFSGCPFSKGIKYHICNYYPDQTKLPPFMPEGSFKMELQMTHHSNEVFVLHSYATVYRPIAYV